MTRESVVARIQKLLAHAKSAEAIGNTEEASAFAAKIEDLLAKNELEMTDVELSEVREQDPMVEARFSPEAHDLPRRDRRIDWQEDLADVLAHGYFCRILVAPGSNKLWFVGRKSHVDVVTYVYARLCREMVAIQDHEEHQLWLRTKREQGLPAAKGAVRGWKASFRSGFIQAIAARLWEAEKARRDQLQQEGNGKALIRLADAHAAVRAYVEAMGLTGGPVDSLQGRSANNGHGWASGHRAGLSASLGANGVAGGGGGPAALPSGR